MIKAKSLHGSKNTRLILWLTTAKASRRGLGKAKPVIKTQRGKTLSESINKGK